MITHRDRDELIGMARSIAARGLSHGSTGNVSIRRGDEVVITPTGSSLATVEANDLAVLSLDDGRPRTDAAASKEAPLHLAVYRHRPEARAVAHTHSTYATALSCLSDVDAGDALPPLTAYYAMRVDALPLVDYCAPGDPRLAELAGTVARDHAAMLLRNHGPVVAATTPTASVDVIEEIEQTARIFLALAGQPIAPLPGEERARLFARAHPQRPHSQDTSTKESIS